MPSTTPESSSPREGSSRLTIAEHLEELRRRLGICLAAVLAGSAGSFAFCDRIVEWLKRPAGPYLRTFAFFSPTEALLAYTKIIVLSGCVLALPVVLSQVWAFVRPALTGRERWYGAWFVGWGSALFVLGGAFAYGVCLPMFLKFLLSVGSPYLEPVISINQYLSFVTSIILICGVVFQLPLVILFFTRIGLLSPEALRRYRSLALLGMLIVAAIATPTTDAISLILVTIPMVVLYEAGIILSRVSRGR